MGTEAYKQVESEWLKRAAIDQANGAIVGLERHFRPVSRPNRLIRFFRRRHVTVDLGTISLIVRAEAERTTRSLILQKQEDVTLQAICSDISVLNHRVTNLETGGVA